MKPPGRNEVELAGLALAARLEYEDPKSDLPRGAIVALLASLTATAFRERLYAPLFSGSVPCTLLFVRDEDDEPAKVALLPGAFQRYDEAVRFWIVNGSNLLLPGIMPEPWPAPIRAFLEKRTFHTWDEKGEAQGDVVALRWAHAAHAVGRPGRRPRPDHQGLHFGLLHVLENQVFDVGEALDVVERIWERADESRPHLAHVAPKFLLRRSPLLIPVDVLRSRGEATPMQALSWYLVEDPYGPQLSHKDAAELLHCGAKEIGTHLKRVREATHGEGLPPVRPDATLPPLPMGGMLQLDLALRGEPKKIPRKGRR